MLRWLIGVLTVFLLIAAGIILKAYHCEAAQEQCQTATSTHPFLNPLVPFSRTAGSDIEQNKTADKTTDACKEARGYFCRVPTPANLPNVLLVLAGFGGIFIAIFTLYILEKQTKATQDSVKIIISKERARIAVKPKYDEGYAGNAPYLPTIAIEITQHGPTKAFNVVGKFRYIINEGHGIPPMKDMWPMNIPDVIPETATPIEEGVLLLNLGHPNLLSEIIACEKFIHFLGELTYTDVFDKPHKTSFRYLWEVSSDEIPSDGDAPPECVWNQGWEKYGPNEDNEAT